ncbi:MAG TPA: hypothetical protein VH597_03140 [Verrucomicrobiae bacterium]|jgi:hypothetical protein|nr:hypothetical protein [Verrucomicrobiae bacterium]
MRHGIFLSPHPGLDDFHTRLCRRHSTNRSCGFSRSPSAGRVRSARYYRGQAHRQGVVEGIDYQPGSSGCRRRDFVPLLTVRGGAPTSFIVVAAIPVLAGLVGLYVRGRKSQEAAQTTAITFRILLYSCGALAFIYLCFVLLKKP